MKFLPHTPFTFVLILPTALFRSEFDKLIELFMDFGRVPEARFPGAVVCLSETRYNEKVRSMSPLCRKNSAAITALESNEPCTVFRLFTIARRVYRSHFTVSSEVGPFVPWSGVWATERDFMEVKG